MPRSDRPAERSDAGRRSEATPERSVGFEVEAQHEVPCAVDGGKRSAQQVHQMNDPVNNLYFNALSSARFRLLGSFRPLRVPQVSLSKGVSAGCYWPRVVENWWNTFINNPVVHKRRQLYLFGETDTGKTSCINAIVSGLCVYRPSNDQWPFSGLRHDHQAIVWDEFKPTAHNDHTYSQINQVIAGEQCRVSVKGAPSIEVHFTGPVIFVSNYAVPSKSYEAFECRVLQVCTQKKRWYTPESGVQIPIPTPSTSSAEEVQETHRLESDSLCLLSEIIRD